MGIEKQKMKQKEENILNKVVKRKKGNNKKNKKTKRKMKTLQKQMSWFFQRI